MSCDMGKLFQLTDLVLMLVLTLSAALPVTNSSLEQHIDANVGHTTPAAQHETADVEESSHIIGAKKDSQGIVNEPLDSTRRPKSPQEGGNTSTHQTAENSSERSKREAYCQPPSNIDELFKSLNNNVDTSMYLRHVTGGRPFLHDELNMDQVADSYFYGGNTCPTSVSDDPQDPLWMRSLCPWYYKVTRLPEGHYPSVIPQAICRCDKCIESNLHECERVATKIRVLKKSGCKYGFFVYTPVTFSHYVGCTCAKRRITQASDTTSTDTSVGSATSGPSSACGPFGCLS